MNKFKSLMLAAAMIGLSSVTSYAATTPPNLINVQFGGGNSLLYSGPGVVGGENDQWNKPVALPVSSALIGDNLLAGTVIYADGSTASGIGFSYTADVVTNAAPQLTGFGSSTQKELMRSYVSTSDGTLATAFDTIDFTGLTAGENYQVWFLSQSEFTEANNFGKNQFLKVDFVNNVFAPITSWTQTIASDGGQTTYNVNQNYLTGWIAANSDGTIHARYSSAAPLSAIAPENRGLINGVQIATPEPASMLLIGVGGALMSAMKARKKKSAEKSIV